MSLIPTLLIRTCKILTFHAFFRQVEIMKTGKFRHDDLVDNFLLKVGTVSSLCLFLLSVHCVKTRVTEMDGSIRHGISLGKTLLNWTSKKDGCNHGYKYINVTEGENSFFPVLLLCLYRSTHFISWGARRSFISVFRVMRIFSDPPHIDTPLHSVSKIHFWSKN